MIGQLFENGHGLIPLMPGIEVKSRLTRNVTPDR